MRLFGLIKPKTVNGWLLESFSVEAERNRDYRFNCLENAYLIGRRLFAEGKLQENPYDKESNFVSERDNGYEEFLMTALILAYKYYNIPGKHYSREKFLEALKIMLDTEEDIVKKGLMKEYRTRLYCYNITGCGKDHMPSRNEMPMGRVRADYARALMMGECEMDPELGDDSQRRKLACFYMKQSMDSAKIRDEYWTKVDETLNVVVSETSLWVHLLELMSGYPWNLQDELVRNLVVEGLHMITVNGTYPLAGIAFVIEVLARGNIVDMVKQGFGKSPEQDMLILLSESERGNLWAKTLLACQFAEGHGGTKEEEQSNQIEREVYEDHTFGAIAYKKVIADRKKGYDCYAIVRDPDHIHLDIHQEYNVSLQMFNENKGRAGDVILNFASL